MKKLYALSGFLGLPSDWEFFQLRDLTPIDWNQHDWNTMSDWAKEFNQSISVPSVLMGYSFGGRMALHALRDQPALWKGAILISAHPGLSTPEEKLKRFHQDQLWAEKFDHDHWPSLMHEWNQQEVFKNDPPSFKRNEEDFKRSALSQALIKGSLGLQDDFKPFIETLNIPILWITGSKDTKFSTIGQNLKFSHSDSAWIKIPEAGHRTPWNQPEIFKAAVSKFLMKI